jgi:tetratricopeptide (TPR) repeat protein/predicted Ser/Thr protein kinase
LPPAADSIVAAVVGVRRFARAHWLELVRRDQCERWRRGSGSRAAAELYFELLPELRADREETLVVVCGEMQLRHEAGESFALEEYLRRFPDLAAEIALQSDLEAQLPAGVDTPDADPQPKPADARAGRLPGYEILRELGRGAAGVVYLARQESTGRLVAVKAISLSATDGQRLIRQRQEAAVLSRLQHPHVVQIYDVIETDGMLCLVIEFVNGPTLVEFAAGKPQPAKEAARLVQRLAAAIHVVHEAGILHRDLKPSNILLTSAGEPKITDFGLAKLVASENQLTTDNCLLGTPSYMPPELANAGGRLASPEGDVYSLGAILYELLVGQPPFLGVTMLDTLSLIRDREPIPCRMLQPQTPRDLETICLKCLEKDPRRRYATAAELAADIGRFLDDSAIEARRPSWAEKTSRWCRRKPGVAILAAGLAVAVMGGVIGVLWQWNRAESARHDADARAAEIQQKSERLRAALALQDRGHIFRGLRRWDDAIAALDEAIRQCPELGSAWQERGEIYTTLGLWDRALDDCRRAFELNESAVSERWLAYGTLLAQSGDLEEYRRLCGRMRERFRGHMGRIAADFIRTCCLLPGGEIDHALAAARLKVVQFPDPLGFYAQGLVLYRAGESRRAAESCLESLRLGENWGEQALNFPVLALAYAKLNDSSNAQKYLDRATRVRDGWIQSLFDSGAKYWIAHKGASAEWQIGPLAWLEFNLLYNEARVELHQPPQLEDPRLAAIRARAWTAIRNYDEGESEYQIAVKLAPSDNRIRMERHRCAGYRQVHRGDFAQAAIEFRLAAEFDPADIRLWDNQAQAHLAAGNVAAYRRVCAEMLNRYGSTEDPIVADRLVWTCANRSNSLPDVAALLPLADLAVVGFPGAARTRGAALVRAGRYEEALRTFEASSKINAPHPSDMCFQAIACCGLGRIPQARKHLADASLWIAQADRTQLPDAELTVPSWANLGWDERFEALRLREEAESLVAAAERGR